MGAIKGKTYATKISDEQIKDALVECHGVVVLAAEKLHIAPKTIYAHFKSNPSLLEDAQKARETILDIAEANVVKSIKEGNLDVSKWYLSKQGKYKGYGDAPLINLQADNVRLELVFNEEELRKINERFIEAGYTE